MKVHNNEIIFFIFGFLGVYLNQSDNMLESKISNALNNEIVSNFYTL